MLSNLLTLQQGPVLEVMKEIQKETIPSPFPAQPSIRLDASSIIKRVRLEKDRRDSGLQRAKARPPFGSQAGETGISWSPLARIAVLFARPKRHFEPMAIVVGWRRRELVVGGWVSGSPSCRFRT